VDKLDEILKTLYRTEEKVDTLKDGFSGLDRRLRVQEQSTAAYAVRIGRAESDLNGLWKRTRGGQGRAPATDGEGAIGRWARIAEFVAALPAAVHVIFGIAGALIGFLLSKGLNP
jgi:hypothetical protein